MLATLRSNEIDHVVAVEAIGQQDGFAACVSGVVPASGSEQGGGQQAGNGGSDAVHEEQLTSIFLAQSGGSAA
jgi:hypothetical protein